MVIYNERKFDQLINYKSYLDIVFMYGDAGPCGFRQSVAHVVFNLEIQDQLESVPVSGLSDHPFAGHCVVLFVDRVVEREASSVRDERFGFKKPAY